MKVLIVSDTHRSNGNFLKVVEKVGSIDMLIHCGDVEGSEYLIENAVNCPVEIVSGNNDFFSNLPQEREFNIGRYRVWVTHGHTYYVSMGSEMIKQEAAARGVDIVFFGHTHRPVIEYGAGVVAVNPGSISYPRQDGRKPSYALLDIDRDGEAHFTIAYLD